MKPMEPYVKEWFEYLEQGKIMGLRCRKCGSYEFPPVPVCNSCGSEDMEWTEMSGNATLVGFSVTELLDKIQVKYGRRVVGQAVTEEGPAIFATVEGWNPDNVKELYEKLPMKVTLGIMQFDGFKFVSIKPCE